MGGDSDVNMQEEFDNFKQKYAKVYSSDEGIRICFAVILMRVNLHS